jgi:hypothetical protein
MCRRWDRLDFVIVVISLIGLTPMEASGGDEGGGDAEMRAEGNRRAGRHEEAEPSYRHLGGASGSSSSHRLPIRGDADGGTGV